MLNTNVLNHENDVFSFDRLTELQFKYLKSPIIVILNPADLGGNFYTAAISQGGYVFKGFDEISRAVKVYGLEDDVNGITNYKDSVLDELNKMKIQMLIVLATMLSNIIVLIMSTLFETMQYFHWNKKVLLLKKIHGFSSLKSNVNYLLGTTVLGIFIIMSITIVFQSAVLVFILSILLFIQLSIQVCYMRHLERKFELLIKEM